MSSRAVWPPARWAAVIAALCAVTLPLAACGQAGPLDSAMTEPQQRQLDAIWTARLAANAEALTAEQVAPAVTAIYQSCSNLERTVEVLNALKATCVPAATAAKLEAVLPERCATPAPACVRALDRAADATDELSVATTTFNEQVAAAIKDPACRDQLLLNDSELAAVRNLSGAYRLLALGVDQNDQDVAALGQRRIDDANAILTPDGPPEQLTERFRAACGVPRGE